MFNENEFQENLDACIANLKAAKIKNCTRDKALYSANCFLKFAQMELDKLKV